MFFVFPAKLETLKFWVWVLINIWTLFAHRSGEWGDHVTLQAAADRVSSLMLIFSRANLSCWLINALVCSMQKFSFCVAVHTWVVHYTSVSGLLIMGSPPSFSHHLCYAQPLIRSFRCDEDSLVHIENFLHELVGR